MVTANYANIFNEIKSSRFLKIQTSVLFITTYIDWTILPFITKLEGTYLPVFMISFYMLIGALDGFVQPLFKNVKIYNIYLFAIVLDIIQILSYIVFSQSIIAFTYVILTIFTIQSITFEIARIHTDDFMQDENIKLKDYLMIRSFVLSGAIVAGGLSSMIFDYFTKDLTSLLIFLSLLGLIGIWLQYMLYKKFKLKIYNAEIEIIKDKKEIFKKINHS